ncbi:MAG: hypothetical protein OEY49_15730 [Candidatus Heimdallarchaeota archaeon]|nr:hypothetical protein [Candidatus Heimdallarchaeota archaeon]
MSQIYLEEINEFINKIGSGNMDGVIYDTAIIASLIDNIGEPRYMNQVNSVLSMQRSDYSWGADYYQPFDRLLTTASVLNMIVDLKLQLKNTEIQNIFDNGISWLNINHPKLIKSEYPIPVAFEFLYPFFISNIMGNTTSLNINIDSLEKARKKKIEILDNVVYNQSTPLLFSMEGIVENEKQAEMLAKFQSSNGSLGASPASTSIFLKYKVKKAIFPAIKYIANSTTKKGQINHFNDYTYMNAAFSLYPLFKVKYHYTGEALKVRNLLSQPWNDKGIPFGKYFPIPDADDTAVALYVLHHYGDPSVTQKIKSLELYEEEHYFKTYLVENSPALMTNMHVLDAFLTIDKELYQPQIDKILNFIKNKVNLNPERMSKYNASTLIQTSNLLLTLIPHIPELAEKYIDYIQNQLNFYKQNNMLNALCNDEISSSILGLLWAKQHGFEVDVAIIKEIKSIQDSHSYNKSPNGSDFTWTSKVQYKPIQIDKANEYASKLIYDRTINS